MNHLHSTLCKLLLLAFFIAGPAMLVAGNSEAAMESRNLLSSKTFHTADAIKKLMKYRLSATLLYSNTDAALKTARIESEKMEAEAVSEQEAAKAREKARIAAKKTEWKMLSAQAMVIYNDMELQDSGLSQEAFEYGLIGYYKMRKQGLLHNTNILSICDFSQSSSERRLYVIDVRNHKLLYRSFVAHGVNSGEEYASSFSNRPESCKSSLGFYVTRKTYTGSNGLSLRIDGIDKGFNDLASRRNIVIHGAAYVSLRILHKYGVMGTTFGCPALPEEMNSQIIPVVKDGSCFFIYYPSKKYLQGSTVLNS